MSADNEPGKLRSLLDNAVSRAQREKNVQLQDQRQMVEAEQKRLKQISIDYEKYIAPLERKFWEEHVPKVLIRLFEDFAGRLSRDGVKTHPWLFFYWGVHSPYALTGRPDQHNSNQREDLPVKEAILNLYKQGQLQELPLKGEFLFWGERKSRKFQGHQEYVTFGIFVTSNEGVTWSTPGGGGNYSGPEDLDRVVQSMAEVLTGQKPIFYISSYDPPSPSGSG
jgi:hypothetical protein